MTAKKAFPEKSFPATVTFRPGQFPIVRKLQDARKLSEVCQKAVDLDAELEALPDGVQDDALEAAAASLFDEWSLSGSSPIPGLSRSVPGNDAHWQHGGRSVDCVILDGIVLRDARAAVHFFYAP
jgi:hypothetical protein